MAVEGERLHRANTWVVRAGENGETVEHNLRFSVVTYKWDQLPNLNSYTSIEELKDDIELLAPELQGNRRRIGAHAGQLWRFRSEIGPGDIVVLPLRGRERDRFLAIGRVTGPYEFDPDQEEGALHRIPVEWLADHVDKFEVDSDLVASVQSQGTVIRVRAADASERLLHIAATGDTAGRPAATGSATPMYVLTWNPRTQDMGPAEQEEHLDYWLEKIRSTEGDATSDGWWSTGNRRGGIREGDDLVLFLHGPEGGIIASGVAADEIYQEFEDETNWIDVNWERWVAPENRLPVEVLRSSVAPGFFKHGPYASGERLPRDEAKALKAAWEQMHAFPPPRSGDEAVATTGGDDHSAPEGMTTRVEVNRYERSGWARSACLEHYGHRCQVCDVDFEERYGELGRGYMHVHHVIPLHQVAKIPNYRVHPINDLRPVCPNCHAMLHRPKDRVLTVEELRELLPPGRPNNG